MQDTILLVDDSPEVLQIIYRILSEHYTVLLAMTCRAALAESRAFAGEIRLLIADLKLSNGDGIELGETVQAERPDCRVLIITGGLEPELADPAWYMLAKPFRAQTLRAMVAAIIGRN